MYIYLHTKQSENMLIELPFSPTKLQELYTSLFERCNKHGGFQFSTERNGYVFCQGKLGEYTARTYHPVESSEGIAFVAAEILCMVQLLKLVGEDIEVKTTTEQPQEVKKSVVKITRGLIENAPSLRAAMNYVRQSGYEQMEELELHFSTLRTEGKRATRGVLADYLFPSESAKTEQASEARKPKRAGIEWMRVKGIVEKMENVPLGYKDADEFATFASKEEVDALKH